MSNEGPEHKEIKEKIRAKQSELFGPTEIEYNYNGNRLDVFSNTSDKIKVYTEIIWHNSKSHFTKDLNSILMTKADIKVVIANPIILNNKDRIREYNRIAINQTEEGIILHHEMIDGQKIIDDDDFFNHEFSNILEKLYSRSLNKKREIRTRISSIIKELKINKENLLGLFASGEPDYLSKLFSNNAWKLNGVYISNFEPSLTEDLIEIYNS